MRSANGGSTNGRSVAHETWRKFSKEKETVGRGTAVPALKDRRFAACLEVVLCVNQRDVRNLAAGVRHVDS